MRTRLILIAIVAMSQIGCGGPVVDREAELASLRTRSEQLVAAEAAFDIPQALTFWAEDAIVQPSAAPQIEGKEAIGELYRQYFESGLVKEFTSSSSHMETTASGDLAYIYGVSRTVVAGSDGDLADKGKFLAVWKKIDGDWFVAALSFTSDAPAPTPIEN